MSETTVFPVQEHELMNEFRTIQDLGVKGSFVYFRQATLAAPFILPTLYGTITLQFIMENISVMEHV